MHALGDDDMMDTFIGMGERETARALKLGVGVRPYIAMANDAADEVAYGIGHEDGYGVAAAYLMMQEGTAPGIMMPPITDDAYAIRMAGERDRTRWAMMTMDLSGMVDKEIGATA